MTEKSTLQTIFIVSIFVCATVSQTLAQTTAFNYQGKLTDNGATQAIYQMEFRLFGSPGGTDQIGSTVTNTNVAINQGVFTVNLDFGAPAFPGADRFLQISVRRNAGESFVTLNPRHQITSSPYSIRTLSAAQADIALDSNKLGGVDASEYVTTATVGNSFIKNDTVQQTGAQFNISGNGTLGGTLLANEITAQTASGNYGLNHTDGTISLSSYVGDSSSGALGAWFGTQSNHPLYFFTNNGQPRMTINSASNVGIGTTAPNGRLEVVGDWNGQYGALTLRGDRPTIRFSGGAATGNQQWLLHQSSINAGSLQFFNGGTTGSFGEPKMSLAPNGNVGIGTSLPATRLALNGGQTWTSAGWTGSLSMGNGSALGWEANASGQQFGIGQSTGGLYFFRTLSAFGSTINQANYDMGITDNGNITQPRNKGGFAKALIYLNADGTIGRCYNAVSGSSSGGCGFSVIPDFDAGVYIINFGFQVDDRYVSVSALDSRPSGGCRGPNSSILNLSGSTVTVSSGCGNGITYDGPVMVMIY